VDAITAFRFISFLSDRNKDDTAASFLDAGASRAGGMEGWSEDRREGGSQGEMGHLYSARAATIETLFPDAGNGRTRFNGCDYGRLIRNAAPAIQRFGSI